MNTTTQDVQVFADMGGWDGERDAFQAAKLGMSPMSMPGLDYADRNIRDAIAVAGLELSADLYVDAMTAYLDSYRDAYECEYAEAAGAERNK